MDTIWIVMVEWSDGSRIVLDEPMSSADDWATLPATSIDEARSVLANYSFALREQAAMLRIEDWEG